MPFFDSVLEIQRQNIEVKINELNSLLRQRNKNLVFIGTIGVGKTTAICSLLDLYDGTENEKKEVLATGAGATTICEVEIKHGSTFQIEITPHSIDELRKMIEMYVDSINPIPGENTISLSTELRRAIEYMIRPRNLNEPTLRNIQQYLNEKIQTINNDSDRARLINDLIENGKIENRTETTFFNQTQIDNYKWLRETFIKLNNGRLETASIPKKISITLVNSKIKNKIIDTKGIDSLNSNNGSMPYLREDLEKHIKNPDNILIYCSSFLAAPDNDIIESIKYYYNQNQEISKRILLLVIPKWKQPNDVQGAEEQYSEGILLRRNDINQVIDKYGLKDSNIKFHNAFLKSNDFGIETNIDLQNIIEFQNDYINQLECNLQLQTANLNGLNPRNLDPGLLLLEQQIQTGIDSLYQSIRNPNFTAQGFINSVVEFYALRYPAWNTKHAIHVRYGNFYERQINIYFDYKLKVREFINHYFNIDQFELRLINTVGQINGVSTLFLPIVENYENKVKELFESITEELKNDFMNSSRNESFWGQMINRRGRGPGYNIEVVNMFRDKINELKLSTKLTKEFNLRWSNMIDEFIDTLR